MFQLLYILIIISFSSSSMNVVKSYMGYSDRILRAVDIMILKATINHISFDKIIVSEASVYIKYEYI